MFLDKYILENGCGSDFPIFGNNDHTIITMPTNDLFLGQFINDNYNAYDIIVKYLAIEQFYGKNDFGFDLYNKMQKIRTGKDWQKRFEELIKSFESGYDEKSYIETDLNYSIHDGAHRTAIAMHNGIDNLNVKLFNTYLYRRLYGFDWFLENDFTKNEKEIILKKYDELYKKNNKPYYCILWSPSRELFEIIEEKLLAEEQIIEVCSSQIVCIPKNEFKKFIYDVYSTDDIKKEKLDIKYDRIMNSMLKDNYFPDSYPIKVMKILMRNPDFRVKPITGLPQSKTTMHLKTKIRDMYQYLITEYYYDIMMHMTDNTIQNNAVEKILKRTMNK